MRHAIHCSAMTLAYQLFGKSVKFKTSKHNGSYLEIAKWPSHLTASNVKSFLIQSGIDVVLINTDGSVI